MAYYNVTAMVRRRRHALGWKQDDFDEPEGASVSGMTMYRAEHSWNLTENSYKRITLILGCMESKRQGILKVNDFSLLLLRNEIAESSILGDAERRRALLEQMEGKINLDVPRNRQYLLWEDALSQMARGEIDARECEQQIREALRYTIPRFERVNLRMWTFHVQELEHVFSLSRLLGMQKKYREQRAMLEQVEEALGARYMDRHSRRIMEIRLKSELADALGNLGEHRKAIEQLEQAIACAEEVDDFVCMPHLYYDKHWNLWQLQTQEALSEEEQEESKRCLLQAYALGKMINTPTEYYRMRMEERYPELLDRLPEPKEC